MELSKVSSGAALYGSNAVKEQVDAASKKPLEKLSKQADSTRVQLSAFGQVKASTAQVEATAKKLQDSKSVATGADAAKAAQGFADAVNGQLKAAKQNSLPAGSARAASEVRKAVEGVGGNNREALKEVGVTFAQDGSVKVDAKALEKAYQANPDKVKQTLSQAGKAAADTSGKQLADSGSVGGAINRLNEKLGGIQQKQADYQARLEQSQKAVAQEEDRRANQAQQITAQQAFGFNGVGAYKRIFFS